MGDVRYDTHYRRILQAADRAAALRQLADDEVIQALAAASRNRDALLANVLATEAMNRMRRSRVITEHLVEGAFAVDGDALLIFVNPALARRTAVEWGAALGRPYREVVRLLREDGTPVLDEDCPVHRAMATAQTQEWTGRVQASEGVTFSAVLTVAPVSREGSVEGAVATLRDITARQRLLARYESLFHHLRRPAFFLDEAGNVTDLNPAAEAVLRAPADDVRGAHFSRFLAPEQLEVAAVRFAAVLSGEERNDDYVIVRPDGTRVEMRITGVPMRVDGSIVGMHGVGEVLREFGAGNGE